MIVNTAGKLTLSSGNYTYQKNKWTGDDTNTVDLLNQLFSQGSPANGEPITDVTTRAANFFGVAPQFDQQSIADPTLPGSLPTVY